MAARKSTGSDYESRYFDALHERLDRQDEAQARSDTIQQAILEQVRHTNGRVTKLEGEVFKKVVPWYSDQKLLYIAFACVLVFLLIIAAVLRVDIPKGIAL